MLNRRLAIGQLRLPTGQLDHIVHIQRFAAIRGPVLPVSCELGISQQLFQSQPIFVEQELREGAHGLEW